MIYITGDTHGIFARIYYIAAMHLLHEGDKLIVCGDFGFVLHENGEELKAHESNLDDMSLLPFEILFIDGNHENFNRLYEYPEEERYGNTVRKIRDNVFHLERGRIYNIDGKSFFTFGGACSVDKERRLREDEEKGTTSWWEQEIPTEEEYQRANESLEKCGSKVDYILTHTAPYQVIRHMGISPDPYAADFRLTAFFDTLMRSVDFRHWYFGHFHLDDEVLPKFTATYTKQYPIED